MAEKFRVGSPEKKYFVPYSLEYSPSPLFFNFKKDAEKAVKKL
jgi:hypothetical protein